MSLTNRLSLFFLTALAVVLVGFSVALYVLAGCHLAAQADEKLYASMQTLVAALEVHPDDVEWEPLERHLVLGEDPSPEQVRWVVHDLAGHLVDHSANLDPAEEAHKARSEPSWRVLVRQVKAGNFQALPVAGRDAPFEGAVTDGFAAGQAPGEVVLGGDRTYRGDGLVLTAAISERPIRATLAWLAGTVTVVSLIIWLIAAGLGRWLCRQALRPVIRMAASARFLRRQPRTKQVLDVAPTRDELEDLGRAFNDLLAELRESLERQDRFTGDASHQLRTPLTAILGHVDVALRKARAAEEYQRVLTLVKKRGTQLQRIIETLLILARADAATPLPDLEVIDLHSWSNDVLAGWGEHSRGTDLHGSQGPAVLVRTHPGLLAQVLENLLDNACKYSEPGTPVNVAVEARDGEAILSVTDEGAGIAADELARVFEPFYRSAQARWHGTPGVGLGLTVVRRLVAVLGGRLEVQSEPGRGSRFAVILPVLAPGASRSAQGTGTAEDQARWSDAEGGGDGSEAARPLGAK